jgi:hypothetical protein
MVQARISDFLDSDAAAQAVFSHPEIDVDAANFHQVYHNFNNRPLAKKIVQFYRQSCQSYPRPRHTIATAITGSRASGRVLGSVRNT